jgi:hypothetical protein
VLAAILAGAACDRQAGPAEQRIPPARPVAPSGTGSPATADTCTAVADPRDRTICLPGRVGPITPRSTRDELAAAFGPASLEDMNAYVGVGFSVTATRVGGTASDSIVVTWTDRTRTKIGGVRDLGAAWRTPEGIHVGSSLAEVEAAFGAVQVLGFGWDYSGTIMLPDDHSLKGILFVRTEPSINDADAKSRVSGDRPFPPTDVNVQTLKPIVRSIEVHWADTETTDVAAAVP